MRQANLEEIDIGVRTGGRKMNNFRYAGDTTLLAETKEELLQLVTSVKEKCAQVGLYLNLKNTNVMSTEEIEEFEFDGENVEIVRDFVFLGAKIEDSGSCKGDILKKKKKKKKKKLYLTPNRQMYNASHYHKITAIYTHAHTWTHVHRHSS